MDATATLQSPPLPTAAPPRSGHAWPLVCILAAGLAIRIALWMWFQGVAPAIWDENDYHRIAVNLIQRGEFALDLEELAKGHPFAMRPPLYPAFLAATYRLFGVDNFQAVRALQLVLSLATVMVVYFLAAEAFSRRVGLWASGLYCFYPSLVFYNNLLLTEVLFTFLLCLACLAVVRFYQRDSLGYAALAGVLLGLASLTRSVLWMSPPLLGLFILVSWRAPVARRILAVGLLGAAFAVTIAPWAVRNTLQQKTFIPIDTMGGRNFMTGNYEYTPLYRAWEAIGIEGDQNWDNMLAAADPSIRGMTQGQKDKRAMRYGLDFIRSHPGITGLRTLVKSIQFWGLERDLIAGAAPRSWAGRELWGFPSFPRIAVVLFAGTILGGYVFTMFTGIFGMVMAPPGDRRLHWFFLLVIVFVWGLHTVVFSHSRYHLPLMPLVLMYSASALVHARDIWSRRGTGKFWLASGLCILLVGGWAWVDVAVYVGLV